MKRWPALRPRFAVRATQRVARGCHDEWGGPSHPGRSPLHQPASRRAVRAWSTQMAPTMARRPPLAGSILCPASGPCAAIPEATCCGRSGATRGQRPNRRFLVRGAHLGPELEHCGEPAFRVKRRRARRPSGSALTRRTRAALGAIRALHHPLGTSTAHPGHPGCHTRAPPPSRHPPPVRREAGRVPSGHSTAPSAPLAGAPGDPGARTPLDSQHPAHQGDAGARRALHHPPAATGSTEGGRVPGARSTTPSAPPAVRRGAGRVPGARSTTLSAPAPVRRGAGRVSDAGSTTHLAPPRVTLWLLRGTTARHATVVTTPLAGRCSPGRCLDTGLRGSSACGVGTRRSGRSARPGGDGRRSAGPR